jgi:hypothetical protein
MREERWFELSAKIEDRLCSERSYKYQLTLLAPLLESMGFLFINKKDLKQYILLILGIKQ